MPLNELMNSGEERMTKTIAETKKELVNIRTGRANPMILDKINVDYYGSATPLRQIANVSVQDGQTLVIQPFDKSAMGGIEKAILKSDLGMTPNNDGINIRITFPALTEERRRELVKVVKKIGEDNKVAVRNIRRDMTEGLKKLEKTPGVSEDEIKKEQEHVQKITDKYIREIDVLIAEKEKEVLSV